jgi:hypothetical protein
MTMQMAELKMPADEARAAFLDYRRAVRANRTAEDELLMNAYRQVASGKRVIDIYATIKAGGLDEQQRPKLAIGRAIWPRVFLYRGHWPLQFRRHNQATYCKSDVVEIPEAILGRPPEVKRVRPDGTTFRSTPTISGMALTPSIPPWARPKFKLEGYHILWEAVWEKAPPVDPALLKHIGGPLYVVLATWDLTPLERSVLSLRLLEGS